MTDKGFEGPDDKCESCGVPDTAFHLPGCLANARTAKLKNLNLPLKLRPEIEAQLCTYCGMHGQRHSPDCIYYGSGEIEINRKPNPPSPEDVLDKFVQENRPDLLAGLKEERANPTLDDPFMEMFRERFELSAKGDITPERRALAEARMRGLASVLSEKSTTFLEYLEKIGIQYTRDVDSSGKKIICITLEDIAESDMKKR